MHVEPLAVPVHAWTSPLATAAGTPHGSAKYRKKNVREETQAFKGKVNGYNGSKLRVKGSNIRDSIHVLSRRVLYIYIYTFFLVCRLLLAIYLDIYQ